MQLFTSFPNLLGPCEAAALCQSRGPRGSLTVGGRRSGSGGRLAENRPRSLLRHVQNSECVGHEDIASGPGPQEKSALPGRSSIGAEQVRDKFDRRRETMHQNEMIKVAVQ